ncbi:hypothetical protein HQ560_18065 [bacterium]|nr:hypothetical protein [bacterium]
MTFRDYDADHDRDAVHRIWRETGWIDKDEQEPAMDTFLTAGRVLVAELDGEADSLPTLDATVNAFSRLWLGVRPASGLAVTDQLSGPPELLAALDAILRLPTPQPDWMF